MIQLLMWVDFCQLLMNQLEECHGLKAVRACIATGFKPLAPTAGAGTTGGSSAMTGDAQHFNESTCMEQERVDIALDLLSHTYLQARSMRLSPLQASTLLSIMWRTHCASVQQRLTIERSFQAFRDMLMSHSLHRPPFSAGIFNLQQMAQLTSWGLNTYFRHYKLYQYAFTARVTMDLATHAPGHEVEEPPALPALHAALTQQEWDALSQEQEAQLEEQRRQAAEEAASKAPADAEVAAAKVADEQRQAELAQQYENSVPEELAGHVGQVLQRELGWLKRSMQRQFEDQQALLLSKIAQLEAKLAAAGAAAVSRA